MTTDMSRHTPGPWHVRVRSYPGKSPAWDVLALNPDAGKDGVSYAGEFLMVAPNLDCEWDARLIAAAPDLLVVCEGVLGFLRALPYHYRPDAMWLQPLEDAIAKATGESK